MASVSASLFHKSCEVLASGVNVRPKATELHKKTKNRFDIGVCLVSIVIAESHSPGGRSNENIFTLLYSPLVNSGFRVG